MNAGVLVALGILAVGGWTLVDARLPTRISRWNDRSSRRLGSLLRFDVPEELHALSQSIIRWTLPVTLLASGALTLFIFLSA